MKHKPATFQWIGPDGYTDLIGQVTTRTGQAGAEMVLDIDGPDDDGPYLIIGCRSAGDTHFAGSNCAGNRRKKVVARWASVGTEFVGRWTEERIDYLFSFTILNEKDEQQ